jgi:RNA polymerase subunit RPABC4/transcription elongation factor Spt4
MKISKLVECKNCGHEIAQEAKSCPKCGSWNFSTLNIVCVVIVVLLILFFFTGGFGLH